MEYKEIEELLNRYLEGETTLEEEAFLKDYFSKPGLSQEHAEMQEMFRYFADKKDEAAPPFDIRDQLTMLVENESKFENRNRFRNIIAWAGSAAAVLVISSGIFQYVNRPETFVKDTFKDPRLAYIETKRALLLISKTMNRNTSGLKYLAKVDESFEHMRKMGEINKMVDAVKNKQSLNKQD